MTIETNRGSGPVSEPKAAGLTRAHEPPTRLERLTLAAKDFETAVRKGDAVPPGGRISHQEKTAKVSV